MLMAMFFPLRVESYFNRIYLHFYRGKYIYFWTMIARWIFIHLAIFDLLLIFKIYD